MGWFSARHTSCVQLHLHHLIQIMYTCTRVNKLSTWDCNRCVRIGREGRHERERVGRFRHRRHPRAHVRLLQCVRAERVQPHLILLRTKSTIPRASTRRAPCCRTVPRCSSPYPRFSTRTTVLSGTTACGVTSRPLLRAIYIALPLWWARRTAPKYTCLCDTPRATTRSCSSAHARWARCAALYARCSTRASPVRSSSTVGSSWFREWIRNGLSVRKFASMDALRRIHPYQLDVF